MSRWHRIQELFQEAAELAPADRTEYLRKESGEDNLLLQEVTALLQADDSAPGLLNDSAAEWISRQLPPPDPTALIGTRVGPYRIESLLQSGGTSDVFQATRTLRGSTQQVVLKVLRFGLNPEELRQRFQQEQETLAALRHPYVVTLLDTGVLPDRRPFLVLESIDGVPVTQWCEDQDASMEQRLQVFSKILAAVQHAHENLIVHRDLKPTNVLVTKEGVPKLLDFGIAELLPEIEEFTNQDLPSVHAPLTYAYASPEQLRGEPVTTRSDVYALGALLHEVLASAPAFGADQFGDPDRVALRPSHVVAEPRLRRKLRGDLDAIIGKALHREPEHRYRSVEQFAADVQRHRAGFPVAARPPTWHYRLRKLVQRQPWMMTASLVATLAMVAGWTGSEIGRLRAKAEASRGWGAHSEAKRSSVFLTDILREITREEAPWREVVDRHAAEIPECFADCPETEGLTSLALGALYAEHGLPDRARPLLDSAEKRVDSGHLSQWDAQVLHNARSLLRATGNEPTPP